jgi:hypothetical protein
MSEIAVQGCTFEASIPELAGSLVSYSVTPPQPSQNVLIGGGEVFHGVYSGTIQVTIPAGATATLTSFPSPDFTVSPTVSPASVSITGTASNCLENSTDPCLQKGDKGTGELIFPVTNNTTSITTSVPVSVTVEITDAGQADVIAS